MRIEIELNNSWMQKTINDRRIGNEKKVILRDVFTDELVRTKIEQYLKHVAEDLVVDYFDSGKDNGEIGEIVFGE